MNQWFPDYPARDADIVDYHPFTLDGCPVPFRGPGFDPLAVPEDSFFTCVGAAQTYGCFVERPFPDLLADQLGLSALNLAVGGAGPGFYLQYPALIAAMNRGRFVVVQAMAARHEANSRFAADGYVEYLRDRKRGDSIDTVSAWCRVLEEEPDNAPRLVAESQANWLDSMRRLCAAITVPMVFLWFSQRPPAAPAWPDLLADVGRRPADELVHRMYGAFPQLVNAAMADEAAAMCTAAVSCVSERGMGAPLINRWTGKPIDPSDYRNRGVEYVALATGRNDYYPSPEMHEDAAAALLGATRGLRPLYRPANGDNATRGPEQ